MDKREQAQRLLCSSYKSAFMSCGSYEKVGISRNFDAGSFPINGIRHRPAPGTSGWYIWSGSDFSEDADFFLALHSIHLQEKCPEIIKYLGLAPGWRFLVAPRYEDVWYDGTLLNI